MKSKLPKLMPIQTQIRWKGISIKTYRTFVAICMVTMVLALPCLAADKEGANAPIAVYSLTFHTQRGQWWPRDDGSFSPDIVVALSIEGQANCLLIPEMLHEYKTQEICWSFAIPEIPAGRKVLVNVYDFRLKSGDKRRESYLELIHRTKPRRIIFTDGNSVEAKFTYGLIGAELGGSANESITIDRDPNADDPGPSKKYVLNRLVFLCQAKLVTPKSISGSWELKSDLLPKQNAQDDGTVVLKKLGTGR